MASRERRSASASHGTPFDLPLPEAGLVTRRASRASGRLARRSGLRPDRRSLFFRRSSRSGFSIDANQEQQPPSRHARNTVGGAAFSA